MCLFKKLSDFIEIWVFWVSRPWPLTFWGLATTSSLCSLANSSSASSAAFAFLLLMSYKCLSNLLGVSSSKVKPLSIYFSISDRQESKDWVLYRGLILWMNIDCLAYLMFLYNFAPSSVRGSGYSACGKLRTKLSNWVEALRLRNSSCFCLRFSFCKSSSCSWLIWLRYFSFFLRMYDKGVLCPEIILVVIEKLSSILPLQCRVVTVLRLVFWKLKSPLRLGGEALRLPWIPFFILYQRAVLRLLWCSIACLSSIWTKSSFLNWAVGVIILTSFCILSSAAEVLIADPFFLTFLGVPSLSASLW